MSICISQPRTNHEIIGNMIQQIVQEVTQNIQFSDSAHILMMPATNSCTWNWLLEKEFISVLQQRKGLGYFQKTKSDSADQTYNLFYAPLKLNINYKREKANLTGTVSRVIHIELFMRIQDASEKVLIARTITKDYKDSIGSKDIQKIEDTAYSYTRGQMDPNRLVQYYVEPLLITVITSAIIYLFYSFRKQS